MRALAIVSMALLLLFTSMARTQTVTSFGTPGQGPSLLVWGTTDINDMRPVIEDFLSSHPGVSVAYEELQSTDLYARIKGGAPAPDVAISTAADLQIKLVNDGFARELAPRTAAGAQRLTSWRNAAFGISLEPAVVVFNKKLLAGGPLPTSRPDLARFVDKRRIELLGRVAMYDVQLSGLGYLFATQDSLYSSTYTTLMQSLGRAGVKLYCCSNEMLADLEKGDALLAYNVLGSYAFARKEAGAPIEIVLPTDYTLVLSRVALVPTGATNPELGETFLDFLLSDQAQERFGSLDRYKPSAAITAHTIVLNPSLLVFLDPIKKLRFISAWRSLIGMD